MDYLPQGYTTFDTVWLDRDIERYNAIQERINAFLGTTMPVPEYLLFDRFNIVASYVNR